MRNIHLQIAPAKSVSSPPLSPLFHVNSSQPKDNLPLANQPTSCGVVRFEKKRKEKTSDAGFHRRQRGGVPLRAAFGISLNFAECNSLAAGQRGVLRVYVRY